MQVFDPHDYPTAVADLLTDELNDLGPGSPQSSRRAALSRLDVNALVGPGAPLDPEMARCCIAGLWLRHDFLEESHAISQEIHTPCGSYWHAIMHRREPDYENAKYWYRRVGEHPVFGPLNDAAQELATGAEALQGQATWDPFRFVDLCRQARRGGPLARLCQQIQRVEWQLLFERCYRRANGR